MKVAIVYHSSEGHTRDIAGVLAKAFEARGHLADVIHVAAAPETLIGYGAIVVGGPLHFGQHDHELEAWVRKHKGELTTIPDAFFSVSLTAASPAADHQALAWSIAQEFVGKAEWRPDVMEIFAGALPYTRDRILKQQLVQRVTALGAGDTDTSHDYDYTDYGAVARFADRVLAVAEYRPTASPAWG